MRFSIFLPFAVIFPGPLVGFRLRRGVFDPDFFFVGPFWCARFTLLVEGFIGCALPSSGTPVGVTERLFAACTPLFSFELPTVDISLDLWEGAEEGGTSLGALVCALVFMKYGYVPVE